MMIIKFKFLVFLLFLGLGLGLFITTKHAQTASNLIAHWTFDEGAGDIVKDIISGYDGNRVGATWITTGHKNGAISFDAMDDYVSIPLMPAMESFTMMFWVKSNGWNTGWGRIFSTTKLNDTSTTKKKGKCKNFEISKSWDAGAFGTYGLGNEWNSLSFAISTSWSHIAFVYNGSNLYAYQNGVLQDTLNASCGIPESKWFFGIAHSARDDTFNEGANVSLDEFQLYNSALTTDEILTEYNNSICLIDTWDCSDWGVCSINGEQSRICTINFDCPVASTPSPATTQTCTPECTEDTWNCEDWGDCLSNNKQTRTCTKTFDCSLIDTPSPATTQSCAYTPPCTEDTWECGSWDQCSSSGLQNRQCIITNDCPSVNTPSPNTTQSCQYVPSCTEDTWGCSTWSTCSIDGQQTRTCTKTFDCSLIDTPSPATTQSCAYTPPCASDTWDCSNWGTCSPQGIQTRNCTRTYDCSSAETASPATSQYCKPPNNPNPQTPPENIEIADQDSIIKSTVKLICPVDRTKAAQGSGTVIDLKGTILTNRHVIEGTVGCLVGFIDDYRDKPYFNDRQIGDIYKVSNNVDSAILKLRNPHNKSLISIDISKGDSDNLKFNDSITIYGYPAVFGENITVTSGKFGGVEGDYLKAGAVIEYGNSGGGAYLADGTFIGMPTAAITGDINSMGYILSINTINNWLNNSRITYDNRNNNNYSRVSSILDDFDLSTLDSLDLFIPEENANDETQANNQEEIEKSRIVSERVKGKILLQVESLGEAYYVNPDDSKKYYLGRPRDAFNVMRNLGLGATHEFITSHTIYPDHVLGKILLDVEQSGEAYYIYPKDKKAYYLGRPADAFRIMRELGLGITNSDLSQIPAGTL